MAELAVKYGSGGSGGQGKLVVGHEDDEGSDEGWDLTGGDDEEGGGGSARGRRGPGKDKKGAKGAGRGRKGGG